MPKGRRKPCFGGCGRNILPFYNPSGYCRKCRRKNELRALKLKKREAKNKEDE